MRYVGSSNTQKSQICSVDLYLSKGQFIVSAKVDWQLWESHEFVMTTYGQGSTEIAYVDRTIASDFDQQMVESYALNFEGTGAIKRFDKDQLNATLETNFSKERGVGFMKMTNHGMRQLKVTRTFYEIKGAEIIEPGTLPQIVFDMKPKK